MLIAQSEAVRTCTKDSGRCSRQMLKRRASKTDAGQTGTNTGHSEATTSTLKRLPSSPSLRRRSVAKLPEDARTQISMTDKEIQNLVGSQFLEV